MRIAVIFLVALSALPVAVLADPPAGPNLKVYDSPYYVIHTDISRLAAQEAVIRMTKMAEEYHRRTSGFSGEITQKLPFYLYRNAEDYDAVSPLKGSAGIFTGKALLAIAGEQPDARTWHTVQHEGFHQFAAAVIGGNLPIWVNEGLAEYFGEGLFTGDSFITGVVPQWRLKRIKVELNGGDATHPGFIPVASLMQMSHAQWNSELTVAHYDQAWSMVHFLAHGDGGKYQQAFTAFMQGLSRGATQEVAWKSAFGEGDGFETRWREYWTGLPDNPTHTLYAKATVSTLTSYLGRAYCQNQKFISIQAFCQAGVVGELRCAPEQWLPPSLIRSASEDEQRRETFGDVFGITAGPGHAPQITCRLSDGTILIGRFAFSEGQVTDVQVEVTDPPGRR